MYEESLPVVSNQVGDTSRGILAFKILNSFIFWHGQVLTFWQSQSGFGLKYLEFVIQLLHGDLNVWEILISNNLKR